MNRLPPLSRRRAAALHGCLVPALFLLHPGPVRAAESDDSCTGFIDSIPASITKQGTWCLRHDLSGNLASGSAIHIWTNNVTIDCNHFKVGNLTAGAGTQTYGIEAKDRVNITVRNCGVRGFFSGIEMWGQGGGHLIEDNVLERNTRWGIRVNDGSVVRRNRVLDTGGSTVLSDAIGISAIGSVDVLDNSVSGVAARPGSNGNAWGIATSSAYGVNISRNRVRGLQASGSGQTYALQHSSGARIVLRDNDLSGDGADVGIWCSGSGAHARQNIINGFVEPVVGCDGHGNTVKLP